MLDMGKWEVDGWRLDELQRDSRDLKRAKALIIRLMAENRALKEERRALQDRASEVKANLKGNWAQRWGAHIMAHRLGLI